VPGIQGPYAGGATVAVEEGHFPQNSPCTKFKLTQDTGHELRSAPCVSGRKKYPVKRAISRSATG